MPIVENLVVAAIATLCFLSGYAILARNERLAQASVCEFWRSRPDGFVDVARAAPGIVVDMRYAGSDNFVGRPINGYDAPRLLELYGRPSR
jgi:D-alanyl-D-alanine dipeptidase